MRTATFSGNGESIITVSGDNSPVLWSSTTFDVQTKLNGHDREITSAEFNQRGDLVLTASLDNTARLWSASTGEQLAILPGHETTITSASFGPDGNSAITTSDALRIWNTRRTLLSESKNADVDQALAFASARQLFSLTRDERQKIHLASTPPYGSSIATNDCDALGIDPLDHSNAGPIIELAELSKIAARAIEICSKELEENAGSGHFLYQTGRAYQAASNFALANKYFRLAGNTGHGLALYSAAEIVQSSSQTHTQIREAIALYQASLDAGFTRAAFRMGEIYWHGTGVAENKIRAFELWKFGARKGDPSCHFELGKLYAVGNLINRSPIEVRELGNRSISF